MMDLLEIAEEKEISDINVIPFIDVMLVLLIIFMVVVPVATSSIPLELPVVSEEQQPTPDKPVILSLTAEQILYLDDQQVTLEGLARALELRTNQNHDTIIFLRVDKEVTYEHVMNVMDAMRQASFLKVALVGKTEVNTEANE